MKIIKLILGLVLGSAAFVVLFFGYLGFVPGLSHLFGSDQARDLGVRTALDSSYSENYQLVLQAFAGTIGDQVRSDVRVAGPRAVDVTLTSEEVTALVQKFFSQPDPLIQNLQIKINDNGVIESSGLLNLKKVSQQIPDAKLTSLVEYAKKYQALGATVPFYISGTGSVTNNQARIQISEVQIGRVTIPVDSETRQSAETLVNRNISSVIRGLSVSSATFDAGRLHLVGRLPAGAGPLK